MATDLREQQRTGRGTDAVRRRDPGRGVTWPYVATAIVLIVLTGVSLLLMKEGAPQPPTSVEQWVASVEGMVTDTREGSGFPQQAEAVRFDADAGAYAKGALTSIREASAEGPAFEDLPDMMTEVREAEPRAGANGRGERSPRPFHAYEPSVVSRRDVR